MLREALGFIGLSRDKIEEIRVWSFGFFPPT